MPLEVSREASCGERGPRVDGSGEQTPGKPLQHLGNSPAASPFEDFAKEALQAWINLCQAGTRCYLGLTS